MYFKQMRILSKCQIRVCIHRLIYPYYPYYLSLLLVSVKDAPTDFILYDANIFLSDITTGL